MNFTFNSRTLALFAAILLAALFRLLPHPPNFSPIAAMALFGGIMIDRKSHAVALPLAAMIISDLALGFHAQIPAVYLSFILIALLGCSLRSSFGSSLGFASGGGHLGARVRTVTFGTMGGSALFFAITNFAVWGQTDLYEKSVSGLVTCFIAALPFLQNSLAGDFVFSAALFGGWALAERAVPTWRRV